MPLEPEGDDSVEFDVQSIDQGAVEPTYRSDDARKAAPIWAESQALREVLDRGQRCEPLSETELQGLRNAVLRQLPTLGLYRQLSLMRQGPMGAAGKRDQDIGLGGNVGLYVLVFPGEAKDNTGIKDLNDKVLGYELNSEWIALRQKAVAEIFWQPDATPPPKWITVGQDYKTAYILPIGKTAKDFADDLIAFDKKLKEYLLAILEKAEQDAKEKKDQNRLKAISDLRKRLNKKEVYRFPYIYGFSVLPLHDDKTISLTLRLVTEALKAAAVVRWAEKRDDLTQRPVKQTASVAPVPDTPRGRDDRGLTYDNGAFLSVYKMADRIKAVIQQGNKVIHVNYNITFVNGVWLAVIVIYNRKPYANPDVIRDIRKKAVVEPKLNRGVKVAFKATVEFMELWLVTINMIDFVAGFLNQEFPDLLTTYHELALKILDDLKPPSPPDKPSVDWSRLIKFLTYDISQKTPRCVLGTTSEFSFYAYSSDWMDQILFAMDIRDLGVALATHYEITSEVIIDRRLAGVRLMRATFVAGDLTVQRKRVTYDTVVNVFRSYYKKLLQSGAGGAAQDLFRPVPLDGGRLPDFDKSIQVMLGGDEVFVAAHPYYAKYISNIINDINTATFLDLPLDIRVGVALSSAEREGGARVSGGPTDGQRRHNQDSHDAGLRAASSTHKVLKALERTHRRIELLIFKLENNPDKERLAPDHQASLDALGLTKLYAQARQDNETDRSGKRAVRLRTMLDALDVPGLSASPDFDLFDYTGRKVALDSLVKKAEALEASVTKDVGKDNYYFETPYITQMPKWFKNALDRYADGKWPFEYDQ